MTGSRSAASALAAVALALAASLLAAPVPSVSADPVTANTVSATSTAVSVVRSTYTNPLRPRVSSGGSVEGCADPSVIRGRGSFARAWFMYCTSDPLNDAATSGSGRPVFTRLPMLRSSDLVHWSFVGSALPGRPTWATASAKLWAPDVVYSSTYARYYMTFAVTDTRAAISGEPGCTQDPGIGVATSSSPTGPWRTSSTPLVPPRRTGPGCAFESTIDPDVLGQSVTDRGVLSFGGFRGGIFAQRVVLARYGMRTAGTATQVTLGQRYEAANLITRGGWFYLLASSGSCCQGPLSGYGVFVGRSRSAFGPFLDSEGNSLLAGRTGGTPALVTNGNHWVGPGHTSAFPDRGGQWWMAYHAIQRSDPFYATEPGFTRRPPMLDPIDWVNGWPTVRSGRGPSSGRVPAPAAQLNQRSAYRPSPVAPDQVGRPLPAFGDEFEGDSISDSWSWVREPKPETYGVAHGALHLATQAAGLSGDGNTASVLTRPAPAGDFVVETALRLDVPPSGCCYDHVQAGLVVRDTDDRLVKLVHVANRESRLTEFGTEVPAGPPGFPRVGSTSVGPPGDLTWLRIVRRSSDTQTTFRAYSSQDGTHWVRGGTWVHELPGTDVRIGLVAMGGAGFTATFDDVRVSELGP